MRKSNIQIDACAPFDAGQTTHNLLIGAQVSNRGNAVLMNCEEISWSGSGWSKEQVIKFR